MVIRRLKRVMKIYVLLTVLVHGQVMEIAVKHVVVVHKPLHIQ